MNADVHEFLPLAANIARESSKRLNLALAALTPRLRQVAEGIRDGKSYSQIGADLGVSTQAAHKLAHAALATLSEALATMGFPASIPSASSKVPVASRRSRPKVAVASRASPFGRRLAQYCQFCISLGSGGFFLNRRKGR